MTLPHRAAVRAWRVASFVAYFAYEFLYSNAMVLREIVSPRGRAAPAIIALPLRASSRLEIVSIANVISLTPGTLTLEVAVDPPTLYVHGMFAADPDAFLRHLRGLEGRMLAALRPVGQEPGPAVTGPVDRR